MNREQRHTSAPDGTALAWTDTGSGTGSDAGRAVVLVHGITESGRTWDPVLERLSETNRIVTVDLRGHGGSERGDDHGLETLAGDVIAVMGAAGLDRPHLVGHSLGGVVVSAVGAAVGVASVTNVDQPLRLAAFKDQLVAAEPMLRDPTTFPAVMGALFESMSGELLSPAERARITDFRVLDQDVVLGIWDLTLTASVEELDAAVDAALVGYATRPVPYLSLFGLDPGDGYATWLGERIPGAVVEMWADHGHYPHLVDPERFVTTIRRFWAAVR